MDKLKQQIQQSLIANVIKDKCSKNTTLLFRDAWCTQDRVIRFTTPYFRNLIQSSNGKWETEDAVMFEAYNRVDSFTIICIFHTKSIRNECRDRKKQLLQAINQKDNREDIVIKEWDFSQYISDTNLLFEKFDAFILNELPLFEKDIAEKIKQRDTSETIMKEGKPVILVLNKYERNQKARAACLAAYGTACAVCGIKFEEAYGEGFKGIIEVHHIIPLSEIKEEYVVDPVNDLVPVCPNCHAALHSKPEGVYTVEELKAIRKKRQSKSEIK